MLRRAAPRSDEPDWQKTMSIDRRPQPSNLAFSAGAPHRAGRPPGDRNRASAQVSLGRQLGRGAMTKPGLAAERREYEFLVASGVLDQDTLDMAIATAWYWGVSCHSALISLGWLTAQRYLQALGAILGLQVIDREIHLAPLAGYDVPLSASAAPHCFPYPAMVRVGPVDGNDSVFFALDGLALPPSGIRGALAQSGLGAHQVVLVSPAVLRSGYEKARHSQLTKRAVDGLRLASPEFSAGTRVWLWQVLMIAVVTGISIGGLFVAPRLTEAALMSLIAVPFLFVVLLRLFALFEVLIRNPTPQQSSANIVLKADQLPRYSILVPLFDEAEILSDLVDALSALDYPAAKLEILLILESIDHATQIEAAALALPPQFRIVVVPDSAPRTKPKALNYALQLARGDFIVVYDAEDMPDPDQLQRAVACYACSASDLACVQARLNIYNPYDGLLTRQFTIEYSALFDALLPAFERLGIPIPLGGTSNHFPRHVLERLGGWDPYNVTEDADLGIRLARAGLKTKIIFSTTYEEAPEQIGYWTRQRTRWLKGWMQTYLVHSRQQLRLARDLGLWRYLGLHVLMGGILLSTLVHPLFYALALSHLAFGEFLSAPGAGIAGVLWWVAGFNLALGYMSSIALGALAVIRRRQWALIPHVLLMPLYWLMISFAAYRALWQLLRDPYKWEKTAHAKRGG